MGKEKIEPQHDKADKMKYALSKDSDQPGSLIRVFVVSMKKVGSLTTHKVHSKDSDQTGHTGHFVGFVSAQ